VSISIGDSDIKLTLADNVSSGFVVYPEVIKRRVNDELPFMATYVFPLSPYLVSDS
jgi:adenylosuccinate lyase